MSVLPSPGTLISPSASSSFDSTVRLWDTQTGACLKTFRDHTKPIFSLSVSPSQRLLATGGSNGWLHVYSTRVRHANVALSDLSLNQKYAQDWTRLWSWRHAVPNHRGVFDMDWQADDRLALALETGDIWLVETKNVPALRILA